MKIALVTVDGRVPQWARRRRDARTMDTVDQYELPRREWRAWRALLVPMHVDQRLFRALSKTIAGFLDNDGTLVVNGALAHPFLPQLEPFSPLGKRNLSSLAVHRLAPHPVFKGVADADLTFRRGVAGFYGRGHNPPPPDAVPLNGLGPDRMPVDWEWHRPDGGRLFMHAGNDLWMYAEDDTSAARILPQLCAWALTGAYLPRPA